MSWERWARDGAGEQRRLERREVLLEAINQRCAVTELTLFDQ